MMKNLLKQPVAETFIGTMTMVAFVLISGVLSLSHAQTGIACDGLRTQTQGGWGQKNNGNGNNVAAYRDANFDAVFAGGLTVGCAGMHTLTLTSAQAVEDFLPSNSQPEVLDQSYTDPDKQDLNNVFAGQIVALALTIGFDNGDPDFAVAGIKLEDQLIASGPLAGLTVGELLMEANLAFGGCASSYTIDELHEAVAAVNENFIDGVETGSDIDCQGSGIASFVFGDLDGDGIQGPDEIGIEGVKITLVYVGKDGYVGTADDEYYTTYTAADGSFSFEELPAGGYELTVDESTLPGGYLPSGGGETSSFNLAPGETSSLEGGYDYLESQPDAELDVTTSSPLIFSTSQEVVYYYYVENTGNVDLSNVTIIDSECDQVYTGGDDNGDGILNVGETWTYECGRYWTWDMGETSVNTNPTVEATDPLGTVVNDSETTNVLTFGINMDVQTEVSVAEPGDVITVRLVTRLLGARSLDTDHDFQLYNIEAFCNLLNEGQYWQAGPSSEYWADPSGDYISTTPGALTEALDYRDHVDYDNGSNAPDWVHEFQYTIPMDQSGDLIINAGDKAQARVYNGNSWLNSNLVITGSDQEIISINSTQSSSISKEQSRDVRSDLNDGEEQDLRLYPTLVEHGLYLELGAKWEGASFELIDAYGRLVLSKDPVNASGYIDLTSLKTGKYWIRLISEDMVATRTIMKIKE